MKAASPETRRIIAAAAAGPLAIIPALMLLGIVLGLFQVSDTGRDLLTFVVVGVVIAYAAAIVVGIPSAVILARINKLSLGSLVVVALTAVLASSFLFHASPQLLLLYCYCAIAVAVGCWLVYQNA